MSETSKLLTMQRRIEELERVLKKMRDDAEKRMVMGFDFQTGRYPLTEDTVSTLLRERDEALARWNAIPWEEIETMIDYYSVDPRIPDRLIRLLRDILAAREEGNE